MTVSCVKAPKGQPKKATVAPKAAGPLVAFVIQDNQDATFTVFGTDAAGAQVDISSVATLTVSSDNTSVLTVDPPVGMGSTVHGVAPGSANLTITATWTDGSVGPFTITQPVTCTGGTATGITVVFGTPTIRP